MALTKREQAERQAERLAFLEKQIKEVAHDKHVTEILLEHLQPQVIVLEAEPKPAPVPTGLEHIKPWTPPRPDSFFSEHLRKLITEHPGMLFHSSVPNWQVGLTLDTSRLVFVPHALYAPYEQECLTAVGWSKRQEEEWFDSITITDEDDPELDHDDTPDIPNPVERQGVWKARQVAHWIGEQDSTPELKYSVWLNGTWG
jgi:hypothetical protein